jgi:hypothetical protein
VCDLIESIDLHCFRQYSQFSHEDLKTALHEYEVKWATDSTDRLGGVIVLCCVVLNVAGFCFKKL